MTDNNFISADDPYPDLNGNEVDNRPHNNLTKFVKYGNQMLGLCHEDGSLVYSCSSRCGNVENYLLSYPRCFCSEDCLSNGNCCFDFITECRDLFDKFLKRQHQKRKDECQTDPRKPCIENGTITVPQRDVTIRIML